MEANLADCVQLLDLLCLRDQLEDRVESFSLVSAAKRTRNDDFALLRGILAEVDNLPARVVRGGTRLTSLKNWPSSMPSTSKASQSSPSSDSMVTDRASFFSLHSKSGQLGGSLRFESPSKL